MWTDNETDKDFLNFSGTAKTVAEMVLQASGKPVSIGVSGDWGVGKSSMIKLVRNELGNKKGNLDHNEFVFVEFNAWLYQGFDDARAALMEVIASTLEKEAVSREKGIDKVKSFLRRVNWVRAAKLTAETAGALALGLPPGILSGLSGLIQRSQENEEVSQDDFDGAKESHEKSQKVESSLFRPKQDKSPPKEIQALRDSFEEALEEIGITLVVFVDDLDRCLPETTISTLEAMRLFLFLKNTAFVIAADDKMIKHAVKKHFEGLEDSLVTNYFDKLIQIPIKVPALGTQEVRAYLFLLFVENSEIEASVKEEVRVKVCDQLSQTWQGKRVDKAFMNTLGIPFSNELMSRIETADRLAYIMTTSKYINGNPRLIKRFLNALSIRMSISKAQGVGVDEAVLTKLLLFERCGPTKAYNDLRLKISETDDGKPTFLAEWEKNVSDGKDLNLDDTWTTEDGFIQDWLGLQPILSDKDLRGALYVSREHAPLMSDDDKLTASAAELLDVLMNHSDMAQSKMVSSLFQAVSKPELSLIMDKVLVKAKVENEWGTPSILESCLALAKSDYLLANRFTAFLSSIPPGQIKADLIPRISEESWAKELLESWSQDTDYGGPVRKAIKKK